MKDERYTGGKFYGNVRHGGLGVEVGRALKLRNFKTVDAPEMAFKWVKGGMGMGTGVVNEKNTDININILFRVCYERRFFI